MHHSALTPVFTTLRVGLHALMTGLCLFVVVHAMVDAAGVGPGWNPADTAIAMGCAILIVYVSGAFLHRTKRRAIEFAWLAALVVLCLAGMAVTPDAAYLVFPLFFLVLHLLSPISGIVAVGVLAACSIVSFGARLGWSVGVVIGPVIGACLAVAIGLGYRALFREARERDALIADLVATRDQLAAAEREAGIQGERARLAREIHDTVAQGLSSIQLLLHAVERADETHPAIEHVRLARQTAATNLRETRRFIAELSPVALDEQTLIGALERLAAATTQASGLPVHVHLSGDAVTLPMNVETALLRVAQSSLANVVQHAAAGTAELTLTYMDDMVSLDVVDDGAGFDPALVRSSPATGGSFGLTAMRDRIAQLGGTVAVESAPGRGTAIAVSVPAGDLPAQDVSRSDVRHDLPASDRPRPAETAGEES